jgi:polysaccharide pyruvyl transferase WcaK-like protein
MPRHIHIGHHFFGSGNIGDDFMLAGFLDHARAVCGPLRLTCCTPFDRECQSRRFEQIEWLPYDDRIREAAIASCDAWLGLGDSPFQSEVGEWFLTHLTHERELCERHGRPMFFLCVGVNDLGAVEYPATRRLVTAAQHIWVRDRQSAALLSAVGGANRVTVSSDLANIAFERRIARHVEAGVAGFLLNFEDGKAFSAPALADLARNLGLGEQRWLVQVVRRLDGSEWDLLDRLDAATRHCFAVRAPDYALASLDDLAGVWGHPELVVTSRYHGALLAAWTGARVVVIERNAKLTGLVEQLGLASVSDLRTAEPVLAAIREATPVPPERLAALAGAAAAAIHGLAQALGV